MEHRAVFFAQKTISTAPLLKVSPAFSKAAGSQGRALSRAPQSAEPPFDFPDLPRGKINQNKKNNRVPQDAKSFAHKVRSWKTNLPVGFPLSCRSCIPSVQAAAVWAKKKERPSERTVFPMSGQWPQSISLAEASDFFYF